MKIFIQEINFFMNWLKKKTHKPSKINLLVQIQIQHTVRKLSNTGNYGRDFQFIS